MEFIISKYNYWAYIVLMMIGFYAMIGKRNLVKKIVGLNIFQTSIILYFISTAAKKGATIPIVANGHGGEVIRAIHAIEYANPLPQALMLTAIVVMVSTFGVALAFIIRIYRTYGTVEEDEIIAKEERKTGQNVPQPVDK